MDLPAHRKSQTTEVSINNLPNANNFNNTVDLSFKMKAIHQENSLSGDNGLNTTSQHGHRPNLDRTQEEIAEPLVNIHHSTSQENKNNGGSGAHNNMFKKKSMSIIETLQPNGQPGQQYNWETLPDDESPRLAVNNHLLSNNLNGYNSAAYRNPYNTGDGPPATKSTLAGPPPQPHGRSILQEKLSRNLRSSSVQDKLTRHNRLPEKGPADNISNESFSIINPAAVGQETHRGPIDSERSRTIARSVQSEQICQDEKIMDNYSQFVKGAFNKNPQGKKMSLSSKKDMMNRLDGVNPKMKQMMADLSQGRFNHSF